MAMGTTVRRRDGELVSLTWEDQGLIADSRVYRTRVSGAGFDTVLDYEWPEDLPGSGADDGRYRSNKQGLWHALLAADFNPETCRIVGPDGRELERPFEGAVFRELAAIHRAGGASLLSG